MNTPSSIRKQIPQPNDHHRYSANYPAKKKDANFEIEDFMNTYLSSDVFFVFFRSYLDGESL